MHITQFGSVYKKSLEESMAITGIIRPEYRQPLKDLRERLGVSEQQANQLFLDAVKKRMIPMVEWIVSEMERTAFTQQQLADRRQKDLGEDYFQSGKGADVSIVACCSLNISFVTFTHIFVLTGYSWFGSRDQRVGRYHELG
jgi:hypothetical protein